MLIFQLLVHSDGTSRVFSNDTEEINGVQTYKCTVKALQTDVFLLQLPGSMKSIPISRKARRYVH
jgi:hypothetical protein